MHPRTVLAFLALLVGCGPATTPADGGPDDLDARSAEPPDATADGPSCACDDGIACTRDRCAEGVCEHDVVHGECADGEYCDASDGCTSGGVCASDADCPRPDPCVTAGCDRASARCRYAPLDGDSDGAAPLACGGDDCDDSRADVGPSSATDACDGIDQDCDGMTDEGADGAPACEAGYVCESASCGCPSPRTVCSTTFPPAPPVCADLASDPENCGGCGIRCPFFGECASGACRCPSGFTQCDAACVDLQSSMNHCGECGLRCAEDSTGCVDGECTCASGLTACRSPHAPYMSCEQLATSAAHCGACGTTCIGGARCVTSRCELSPASLRAFVTTGYGGVRIPPAYVRGPDGTSYLAFGVDGPDVVEATPTVPTGGPVVHTTSYLGGTTQWLFVLAPDGSFVRAIRAETRLPLHIALGADGALYAAGRFDVSARFGTTTLSGGATNGVVARILPTTGEIAWTVTLPAPPSTAANVADIAETPAGDLVVVGNVGAHDFGGGALPAPTLTTSGFVWVFAPDRSHRASFRVPGAPESVAVAADGDLVVLGEFSGAVTIGSTTLTAPPGESASYVARFAPDGMPRSAFAAEWTFAHVATMGDDVVLAAGLLAGADRGAIARYSSTGAPRWTLRGQALGVDAMDVRGELVWLAGHGALGMPELGDRALSAFDVQAWAGSIDATTGAVTSVAHWIAAHYPLSERPIGASAITVSDDGRVWVAGHYYDQVVLTLDEGIQSVGWHGAYVAALVPAP